jgi:putative ABC transport system permease protein
MKQTPPKWADKFLTWYCREDIIEEIRGDMYELYARSAKVNKRRANLDFIWNVLRFFRWKNIRKRHNKRYDNQFTFAMIKNVLVVAFRNFFRQPATSLMNVLGLAVGFICAFLVIVWVSFEFSFDSFHDKENLHQVYSHVRNNEGVQTYGVASAAIDLSSIPEVEYFTTVASGTRWPNVLCFRPEDKIKECVYLSGIYSNENLFKVFGFTVLHGEQTPLLKPSTILVSQKMALALFGTEDVVGKTLKVDDHREVAITSVFQDIPANSTLQFDFVMPYNILQKQWGIDEAGLAKNFFEVYIKTNKPVSSAHLNEKLNDISVVTEEVKAQNISYQSLPASEWRLKNKFENGTQAGGRIEYVILFCVIGALVTLMAVINFINMTTARAATRAKEIGIRKVTGAFRSGIIFQFVGEAFFVVLFAFLVAGGITQLLLPVFSYILGEQINVNLIDGSIPFYLIAFLLVVALLAGLYPAFVLSSFKPVSILKGNFGNTTGSRRLRKGLLIAQLSISIGIIIFSGVIYLQLKFVTNKNLGFDRENTIRVEPTIKVFRKFDVFKNELFKHPEIIQAGTSNINPLNAGGGNTGVTWQGKPKDLRVSFTTIGCSYEFPETIGLQLIEGRNFQSQPLDSFRTEVLVTKDAVATMGLKNPVGERIEIGGSTCVIIGVVDNFHTASLHANRLPAILYRTEYERTSAVYVKYKPGTTQRSLSIVADAYKLVEPDFTMKYWFQDDTFNDLYKSEIITSRLILGFTGIALIIAVIGIVGLSTFNSLRRTKEIGIRRVFGASVVEAITMLMNEFSVLLMVAILIAGPIAWYAADQWLQSYAYRTAIPWWIFAATFAGIALLIALIVGVQGLRTVSSNPAKTLRSE